MSECYAQKTVLRCLVSAADTLKLARCGHLELCVLLLMKTQHEGCAITVPLLAVVATHACCENMLLSSMGFVTQPQPSHLLSRADVDTVGSVAGPLGRACVTMAPSLLALHVDIDTG